jgi:ubiquinone/menaquinone biosynthesis C-methylase UbiE
MGIYARHVFPRLLDWGLGTSYVERERRITLAEAEGKTLEIGFGTGLNLPCYPPAVTSITAIDNESMLESRVNGRIERCSIPVERIQLDAGGGRLPFDDSSFDTVVTTFTLCSISDVKSALAEIRRITKPSGKYLFLEHGRSPEPSVSKWQDRLNPLQKLIGRGCNMNREIDRLVEEAEFSFERLDRFLMPDTPRMLGTMYRGLARTGEKQV